MKKRVISEGLKKGGQKSIVSQDTKIFGRCLAVLAHLSEVVYDDGTPRKPGTIIVRTIGTSFQVIAKDPDASAQIVALGQTIDEALVLLDKLLAAEDAPWEVDPYAGSSRRKR